VWHGWSKELDFDVDDDGGVGYIGEFFSFNLLCY
jgi:hypothetical protein